MFNDQTLVIINIACIVFLTTMLITLAAATRMKSGAGWAAVIIVTTTVPMILSNLMRDLSANYFLFFLYPAFALNMLLMPSLWFFVRSRYEKSLRLTVRDLMHLIPSFISFFSSIIYYSSLSAQQIESERIWMKTGGDNLPALINDVLALGQFVVYYLFIFAYIRKKKKFLQNNYSDSEYLETRWVPRFLALFFGLFFAVFVAYAINPRTDTWLIPILNCVAMAYLVYCVIFHSTAAYLNRLPDVSETTDKHPVMSDSQMSEICDAVTQYLQTSGAYKNSGLSLATLSVETNIHSKNISIAINGYLHKNFFELVNEMRVDEAKRLLRNLGDGYTIESIFAECGFRSRTTFFVIFKKIEGKTPAQWLKTV